jgi:hypothetical protein
MISFVVGLHCYVGRRQIVALFWFLAPDCRDILVFGARLKKKNIADSRTDDATHKTLFSDSGERKVWG